LSKKNDSIFLFEQVMQWRRKEGGKWEHTPWAKVLRVHQHTWQ